MTYKLHLRPEVAAEILSASSDCEGVREGLGAELEEEVGVILRRIQENPNLYRREHGPIRRALVRRFNQLLYYAVEGDLVVILEFRDARREPPDWTERGYPAN